ncbi:unnamed protein product [Linum trigynum]|uniref:Uncharacterized protein n=1 Tax=Linum trigynum TaxID=586398 RepID=A0AAV2F9V7_9ROSI
MSKLQDFWNADATKENLGFEAMPNEHYCQPAASDGGVFSIDISCWLPMILITVADHQTHEDTWYELTGVVIMVVDSSDKNMEPIVENQRYSHQRTQVLGHSFPFLFLQR